ncbi:unnamed protein product [Choristocarpus tenellus]
MKKYNADVNSRRKKADEKVAQWSWQSANDGKDPIIAWRKMKAEGKIPDVYDEEENQEGGIPIPMASFGVGGSFGLGGKWDEGARFDLRLPYVDQGYVDEDADVMAKIASFFGGGKKKEISQPESKGAAPKKAIGGAKKNVVKATKAAEEKPKKKGWW